MPINYKKYRSNWKTKIRPDILERADNRCEKCGVKNYELILRGELEGLKVYMILDSGDVFSSENGDHHGRHKFLDKELKPLKVVLTVAHLDHDVNNNDYSNLKALCQYCHNNYDMSVRVKNRKSNKFKNQSQVGLF